jgi:membrane protein implicated in regulation of membrane protease activity
MDIQAFVLTPWFWLLLTVIFAVLELACAFNLITIWFAVSAFVLIFISGVTELLAIPFRFRLHCGLFLFIAAVLLIFTRPLALQKLKVGKVKTNVDSLPGCPALVTKKITKFEKGEIKLNGQLWTALSEDGAEIAAGAECLVVRIEGVKAIVRRAA